MGASRSRFCRAPMAKSLPAYIHRPKKARISATSFILSCSIECRSVPSKLFIHPYAAAYPVALQARTPACSQLKRHACIYIYIYIYGKFFVLLYTHTSNPSMHYGRNSRPWLQPTYCFPALQTCFAFRPLSSYCNICKPSSKQHRACMSIMQASKRQG